MYINVRYLCFRADVIPIVMGARKEEYARLLPDKSFIHVDDFASPKELAAHLNKLDKDDSLYNEYFKWKGYAEPVDTNPWCRMCSLLNQDNLPKMWYENIDAHWRKHKCIGDHSWINNTYFDNVHIGEDQYNSGNE